MDNHCTVRSLSEYIAAIEKYNLFDSISRGESREFNPPLRCSIYRHDLDQYTRMLEQYHLDVETAITPVQDRNFLAFAQHHGLPTNLLDFSFSPLVSLYFCVDGCTGRGYVYFVHKDKLVGINEVLYNKPLGWGMFEELLNYDTELFRSILPQMSDVLVRNAAEMSEYFEHHAWNLIAAWHQYQEKFPDASGKNDAADFERMVRQYEEYRAGLPRENPETAIEQLSGRAPSMIKSMQKILKNGQSNSSSFYSNYRRIASSRIEGTRNASYIHLLMFLLKLEEMECYSRTIIDPANPVYELEFPFYFSYHPPVIDDRVRNQYSVFIFQPFVANKVISEKMDFSDGEDQEEQSVDSMTAMARIYQEQSASAVNQYLYGSSGSARQSYPRNTPVQVWQKISPDFTMEITNPALIRRELDAIGINSKNIYCDYDSIAEYIVASSSENW